MRRRIGMIGVGVVLAAVVAAARLPIPAAAQTALNWSADDGARIEVLKRTGDHIEGEHLVLWFPASLARPDAEALVMLLIPPSLACGVAWASTSGKPCPRAGLPTT